ncbi:MAG TPA: serine/threonine-protein kinase, partial [Haliangiales bacterium]|nr:serine/threonine-protein kinase [Haliangiales bacterium]
MLAEPKLPQVFGRYVLLRRISRGGMGEIFLAKSGQLSGFEKVCVIKKILPHLAADKDFTRRFIDEAQVAIKLSHANIAQVMEVGKVEGEYFLALEYIEGRDLRRILTRMIERRMRMPIDLSLWTMREVASGLAYAHRRSDDDGRPLNLVHCDISPPNVLCSFEGEVKIIDFGIAKSALRVAATNPKIGFGKYGYMAPEQLIRGGVVDRRTDVYAAGVLLYELLTGQRMFIFPEGADYRQMARIVARGEHARPGDNDQALRQLDDVVLRAVAPDPDKRHQTAAELRDELSAALAKRSPTLTGDRLAGFVRDLFAEEVAVERDGLRQMMAIDMAPFEEEMAGQKTETVTFAAFEELSSTKRAAAAPPVAVAPEPTPPPPPRRRWRAVAFTAGAAAAGAALAFALTSGGAAPAPPDARPAPRPTATVQPFVVTPVILPPEEP